MSGITRPQVSARQAAWERTDLIVGKMLERGQSGTWNILDNNCRHANQNHNTSSVEATLVSSCCYLYSSDWMWFYELHIFSINYIQHTYIYTYLHLCCYTQHWTLTFQYPALVWKAISAPSENSWLHESVRRFCDVELWFMMHHIAWCYCLCLEPTFVCCFPLMAYNASAAMVLRS